MGCRARLVNPFIITSVRLGWEECLILGQVTRVSTVQCRPLIFPLSVRCFRGTTWSGLLRDVGRCLITRTHPKDMVPNLLQSSVCGCCNPCDREFSVLLACASREYKKDALRSCSPRVRTPAHRLAMYACLSFALPALFAALSSVQGYTLSRTYTGDGSSTAGLRYL